MGERAQLWDGGRDKEGRREGEIKKNKDLEKKIMRSCVEQLYCIWCKQNWHEENVTPAP